MHILAWTNCIIDLCIGLTPVRWQAITYTNADLSHLFYGVNRRTSSQYVLMNLTYNMCSEIKPCFAYQLNYQTYSCLVRNVYSTSVRRLIRWNLPHVASKCETLATSMIFAIPSGAITTWLLADVCPTIFVVCCHASEVNNTFLTGYKYGWIGKLGVGVTKPISFVPLFSFF